jgi:chromate reductase
MYSPGDVAVLIGSLRKRSLSRQLAMALRNLAPAGLQLEMVEIGALPLYNQDIEDEGHCAPWTAFRDHVRCAGAVLFVTPEYNRSVPAALKNAVDVGSRPYGKSVWAGKPGAVISVSPGALGGFGANSHLRQILASVSVPVLPQPEVYISGADKLFDAQGGIGNESTRGFLRNFMESFGKWIDKNQPG